MSEQVPMWWSALWDTLKVEQSLIVSLSSLHTYMGVGTLQSITRALEGVSNFA